ncbi:hypothetical protein [Deinococcus marmoris]|nr:hypothetical protein [Deinococcus marmoris]
MADRRAVMELAHRGVTQRSLVGAEALMRLPIAAAKVLEEMTDGPVRAYMAVGVDEVAALEAFMAARPKVDG